MPEFISILDAKILGKGNIRFIVLSLEELKSGTTKTGDKWKKQVVVIRDNSGIMNLTLWNENIGEILVGKLYTLENGFWTIYKKEPQLTLGKFYKLNEVSELTPVPIDVINEEEKVEPVPQTEMLVRIYDMTKEMYHDFIDKKLKESQ